MKTRLLFVIPILALAAVLGLQAQSGDQTALGAKMDSMSKSFRALNKQVDDSTKNADSLQKLAALRADAEAALKMEPARKATTPAADQAKFMADYQARMKDLLAEIGKAEAAFKAGNNAEAKAVLGSLKQIQTDSHKSFKQTKKKAP